MKLDDAPEYDPKRLRELIESRVAFLKQLAKKGCGKAPPVDCTLHFNGHANFTPLNALKSQTQKMKEAVALGAMDKMDLPRGNKDQKVGWDGLALLLGADAICKMRE